VLSLVERSLDAFARLDVQTALRVAREDSLVDGECRAITRQLLTYMMEDPRTIGAALHLVWAARALERAGDHAKNLAEYVMYAVHGKDLRHMSLDERERRLSTPP
jgi:phosphate transport system protein